MSLSRTTLDSLIPRLLSLSRDRHGLLSEQKVGPLLTALKKAVPWPLLKPLLQKYQRAIRQTLGQEQAVIEHAGDIKKDTIKTLKAALEKRYNRPIQITARDCPELIAGLRICIANDVYEVSPAADLQKLLHSPSPIN